MKNPFGQLKLLFFCISPKHRDRPAGIHSQAPGSPTTLCYLLYKKKEEKKKKPISPIEPKIFSHSLSPLISLSGFIRLTRYSKEKKSWRLALGRGERGEGVGL